MAKIAVTLPTLESRNHLVGDIERGVKIYSRGGVEFEENEPNYYWAHVPHKGKDLKSVAVSFSRDGCDLDTFYCSCTAMRNPGVLCRHVVAAVLAIQGGIVDTLITLGKTASVSTAVTEQNTACAVGSGSLDVFATPMMIALMEHAACEALSDALGEGQTSVGTGIDAKHTAASPMGANITATATVTSVSGRMIEFDVAAQDGTGEIGRGKHTRVIVDAERFIAKANTRNEHEAMVKANIWDY